MRRDDLDYPLDPRLIATEPATPRDSARLMVVHPDRVEHRRVRDLPEYLRAGDLMVVNATRVEPRRVILARATGGRLEGLLLEPLGGRRWRAMLKGGRRVASGERLDLLDAAGAVRASLVVEGREGDAWSLRFEGDRVESDDESGDESEILRLAGRTPLPPYILRARRERGDSTEVLDQEDALDRDRYQTVYAHAGAAPSVAAPTAGLHFTPDLLRRIREVGVERLEVELQVGPGTFRSVETERLEDHRMDREGFRVAPADLARLIAHEARRRKGEARTLAVGSTSVRTLESLPEDLEALAATGRGIEARTDLLVAPGTPIRRCDLLLTNFHLPKSTLVALVAALIGLDRLKSIYALAASEGYRFFSYGDAMLILPREAIRD